MSDLPLDAALGSERATIVVSNTQLWSGDQRLGAFYVTLDGLRAGVAFPGDRATISCAPGRHVVRIRQWWFKSDPVTVEVGPAQELHFVASGPRGGNAAARMITLLVRPSRSLKLDPRATGSASE
jgi:hypothetical protein